jgi:cullin 1
MLFPNTWKAEYSSGFQMYLRLTQYLNTHLDNVREESKKRVDESLLVFFVDEWKRYSTAAIFLNHLFGYINRHWIKRRMDEGKKDIYDVHTLHMAQWKSKMFDTVYERAMESVLNITKRQRGGEWIGFTEVRQFINSFSRF